MPDFSLELETGSSGIVIGLDEAGRGPWAGPVVAAAVWLDRERTSEVLLCGLDDSKALTPAMRETLYHALGEATSNGAAACGIGQASVIEIDTLNILQASLLAMRRAADDLGKTLGRAPGFALVDGAHPPELSCPARAVVRGDGLSLSIAAASILAKVTRDRLMADLAKHHPGYGWARNKGYGTAEHRRALAAFGITAEHRRSFRPVREHLSL